MEEDKSITENWLSSYLAPSSADKRLVAQCLQDYANRNHPEKALPGLWKRIAGASHATALTTAQLADSDAPCKVAGR